jgi:hypothetical protein
MAGVKYQVRLVSGKVVVIDPLYIDYAQKPSSDKTLPALKNSLYLSSTGLGKLLALEAVAFSGIFSDGNYKLELNDYPDAFGYYEIPEFTPGIYQFDIADILDTENRESNLPDPTNVFSIDTGQFLVFDLEFIDGILEHFSWEKAYRKDDRVNRILEKKNSLLICGADKCYIQVQSPGIQPKFEFIGDGDYFFRPDSFRLVSPSTRVSTHSFWKTLKRLLKIR